MFNILLCLHINQLLAALTNNRITSNTIKKHIATIICFTLCLMLLVSAENVFSADVDDITIVCDEETNLYIVSGTVEAAKDTNVVSVEVTSGGEQFYANTLYTNRWGEFYVEFFMPDSAVSGEYMFILQT